MTNRSTKKYIRATALMLICSCFLSLTKGMAQRDMILTQAGEELRCRIIDETPVRFVFAYLKDGKPYRSEIFKNLVTSFKFNYYSSDLPNADKLPEAMYRATDTVDPQSPRGLRSSNEISGKVSRKEKRRQKKASDINVEENKEAVDPVVVGEELSERPQRAIKPKVEISKDAERKTVEPLKQINSAQSSTTKETSGNIVAEKNSSITEQKNTTENTTPSEAKKANDLVKDNNGQLLVENRNRSVSPIEGSKPNAENVVRKTNQIEAEQQNEHVGTEGAAPQGDISETELPNITINQENKFRIGVKGGIGNRLDNNLQTINSYDLYLEQLLRGWTLGADIAYFPSDILGFGAIFTDFKSRNSDNEILYRNEFTGAEQIGSITNNRSVKFIGPALFLRKKLDYKTYVVLGLSPGYNFYQDRGSYDGVDYTFRGSGFGAASTLGIDFLLGNDIIGRDIILSFEAGYNYGQINALDYGDARGVVDLATPLDLSRLDFTIGLRFIRFPKYFRLTSY